MKERERRKPEKSKRHLRKLRNCMALKENFMLNRGTRKRLR